MEKRLALKRKIKCQKQTKKKEKKPSKCPQEIVLFVTNWQKACVPFVNMFSTVVETAKESIGIRIKKIAKV